MYTYMLFRIIEQPNLNKVHVSFIRAPLTWKAILVCRVLTLDLYFKQIKYYNSLMRNTDKQGLFEYALYYVMQAVDFSSCLLIFLNIVIIKVLCYNLLSTKQH